MKQSAENGYAKGIGLVRLCLADSLDTERGLEVMHSTWVYHVIGYRLALQPHTEIMRIQSCVFHTYTEAALLYTLTAKPAHKVLIASLVVIYLYMPFFPINFTLIQGYIQRHLGDIYTYTIIIFHLHISLVLQ